MTRGWDTAGHKVPLKKFFGSNFNGRISFGRYKKSIAMYYRVFYDFDWEIVFSRKLTPKNLRIIKYINQKLREFPVPLHIYEPGKNNYSENEKKIVNLLLKDVKIHIDLTYFSPGNVPTSAKLISAYISYCDQPKLETLKQCINLGLKKIICTSETIKKVVEYLEEVPLTVTIDKWNHIIDLLI